MTASAGGAAASPALAVSASIKTKRSDTTTPNRNPMPHTHLTGRSLLAATALLALTSLSGPALAAPPAATDPPATPTTDPDTGLVLDENGIPDTDVEGVVHSWSLMPGDTDGSASTRAELSYTANPGDVITDSVVLYNLGNTALTFKVYATDALNNPEGEVTLLRGGETPTGVGTWVALPRDAEAVEVQPGMHASIPFEVRVPSDARPGDHVGAVLASNAALSPSKEGAAVAFDRRIGPLLSVRVNGPIRPELSITGLSVHYDPSANPLGGHATVTYAITNTGDITLASTADVSVAGPFGMGRRRLPTVDVPKLLPGEDVTLTAEFDEVPALGLLTGNVDLHPSAAGDGALAGPTTRSSRTVAPPITVALLLAAALAAALAARAYRRHRRRDAWELVPDGPQAAQRDAIIDEREPQPQP